MCLSIEDSPNETDHCKKKNRANVSQFFKSIINVQNCVLGNRFVFVTSVRSFIIMYDLAHSVPTK